MCCRSGPGSLYGIFGPGTALLDTDASVATHRRTNPADKKRNIYVAPPKKGSFGFPWQVRSRVRGGRGVVPGTLHGALSACERWRDFEVEPPHLRVEVGAVAPAAAAAAADDVVALAVLWCACRTGPSGARGSTLCRTSTAVGASWRRR